jgi:hypothetical protein
MPNLEPVRVKLPPVSSDVEAATTGDLQLSRRRHALLVPAVLATCLGGALLALSLLLLIVGELVGHSALGRPPAGMTYIPPSGSDQAMSAAQELGPIVVGVGLLLLTWRYRGRGRVWATWVCAVAMVLVSVAALV